MTRVYYKEAVGCFIVFDITRPSTFEAVERWKKDLDSKVSLPDGSRIPCVLLANKVRNMFAEDITFKKSVLLHMTVCYRHHYRHLTNVSTSGYFHIEGLHFIT